MIFKFKTTFYFPQRMNNACMFKMQAYYEFSQINGSLKITPVPGFRTQMNNQIIKCQQLPNSSAILCMFEYVYVFI